MRLGEGLAEADPPTWRPPVVGLGLDDRLRRDDRRVHVRVGEMWGERQVLGHIHDLDGRRGVLALMLAHLPPAAEEPDRVVDLGAKAPLQTTERLAALEAAVELVRHPTLLQPSR